MTEEEKREIKDYKNSLIKIPEELKNCNNWVCYMRIMDENKGKYSKIPVDPKTLRGAKSNDPTTWDSYENATMRLGKQATVKTKVDGQDKIITSLVCGLGFMFSNSEYFGIDLDDCDNEKGRALIKEFTQTLESYTEYSPSGKGIHIICKGHLPNGAKRKGNIEMYESGRFFTMTGNIYQNYTEISDCTEKVKQLHQKYLNDKKGQNIANKRIPQKPIKKETSPTDLLEDVDILDLIRKSKNNLTFEALYNNNGWQDMYKLDADGNYILDDFNEPIKRFPTQSDADIALCGILAFFTRCDYSQIDRIFRNSGLMRNKWDEIHSSNKETYGEMTINTAIANCSNVYDPNYKSKSYKVAFEDKGETHSNNTPQPEQSSGEELPPDGYQGIHINHNSYFAKAKDRRGEEYYKPLTDFIFKPIESIKYTPSNNIADKFSITKTKIIKDTGEIYVLSLPNTCFADIKTFKSLFIKESTNFKITATANEWEAIRKHMNYFKYPQRTGVRCIGLHKFNDKWCFVGNDKTINADGEDDYNHVFLKEFFEVIKTNILNYDEITKEELETLKPHLFNFTEPSRACIILGYIASCWFRMIFKEANLYQPHLQLIGEAGSGKTTTRNNIIMPFFAMASNAIDANQITHFSGIKAASSSNTIPMLVEEYKPHKMSESRKQNFSDLGRNCYDGTDATRGRADQTIETYPQTTPIILIGEAGTAETALEERSIILNFNKLDIIPERTESMKFLQDNKELISKLGRTVLSLALKTDKDTLKNLFKKYEVIFKEKITTDRIRNSACIASIGYKALISVFKMNNIDVPISLNEMIASTSRYIFEDMLDSSKSPKTVVERTLEMIDTMVSVLSPSETNCFYRVKDNELILDVKLLYPFLTKYIKDYGIKDFEVLSQDDFTRQLRKTQYFLAYRTSRMPDMQEVKEVVKRCYILSIPRITAKLELNNMLKTFIEPDKFMQ